MPTDALESLVVQGSVLRDGFAQDQAAVDEESVARRTVPDVDAFDGPGHERSLFALRAPERLSSLGENPKRQCVSGGQS